MSCNFPNMFLPADIGNVQIRNRIVMPALATGLANEDGTASIAMCDFYAIRAAGGAGLIISEPARISTAPTAAHIRNQLGAFSDDCIPGLKKLATAVQKHGAKIFLQLCHPGNQTDFPPQDEELLTPSGEPSAAFRHKCKAMSHKDIDEIVSHFASAAARAKAAGFDGVEINAAHGYLLGEFLSQYTNHRTDEYGGSVPNRCLIVIRVIEEIRRQVGKTFPLALRISADEFLETAGIKKDGIKLSDAVAILNCLLPYGIDAVDVSSGIYETQKCAWEPISFPQGWKTYLSECIKRNVDVPVIGVAAIKEPEYAESIIRRGAVDFVGVGRGQIADPEWAEKAKNGRAAEIRRCISCLHCMENLVTNGHAQCAINPRSHHENEYGPIKRCGNGEKVVVVGGGPAGMEASRMLALKGYKPVLFEKFGKLGGQLGLADKPPHKGKIDWLIDYYEERLEVLNVDVRLNTEATVELIEAEDPAAVIIAVGSKPNMPDSIVGIHGKNVVHSSEILSGKVRPVGKQIIVVGDGQTGIETADMLGFYENVVSVVGRGRTIGEKIYAPNRMDVLDRLTAQHARFFPNSNLVAINSEGITVENVVTGDLFFMPTDMVVLALGVKPDTKTIQRIKERYPDAICVGDAVRGGRIADAVHSAYVAVNSLDKEQTV